MFALKSNVMYKGSEILSNYYIRLVLDYGAANGNNELGLLY